MRVMVIVKATKNSEAGMLPSEKLLADMSTFNEKLVKAGIIRLRHRPVGERARPGHAHAVADEAPRDADPRQRRAPSRVRSPGVTRGRAGQDRVQRGCPECDGASEPRVARRGG